jgi:hypothetical protein
MAGLNLRKPPDDPAPKFQWNRSDARNSIALNEASLGEPSGLFELLGSMVDFGEPYGSAPLSAALALEERIRRLF